MFQVKYIYILFTLLLFLDKALGYLDSDQAGNQDRNKELSQDGFDLTEGHCQWGLWCDVTVT